MRINSFRLEGLMMNVPRWIRFAAGTIALIVTLNSASIAAPLLATVSSASTAVADVTPVRWRSGGPDWLHGW